MKIRLGNVLALGVLTGCGGMVASCGGDDRPPMTPAAQVAHPVAPAQAVDEVANARCNHEQKCSNIGQSREFQSREHCMQSMRADASEALAECNQGIASHDLQQCLSEISNEDCGGVASVLDNLDTYMSCRSGALCLD